MTHPHSVSLVIPVREPSSAKSRLVTHNSTVTAAQREALAAAIALDTVEAARAARSVGELIVVGALREGLPGVRVIDDPGAGLVAAIEAGLAEVDPALATTRAVLLGDVPALGADDLDATIDTALEVFAGTGEYRDSAATRAFVPDSLESGTTFVIAAPGVPHDLRFGPNSSTRHRAAGYRELALSTSAAVRRDVDTLDELLQLQRLHDLGALTLGHRTRAALDAL